MKIKIEKMVPIENLTGKRARTDIMASMANTMKTMKVGESFEIKVDLPRECRKIQTNASVISSAIRLLINPKYSVTTKTDIKNLTTRVWRIK